MIVADTVWNAFVWKQDPSYDYCAIFNTPYLGIKLTLGDHFQHGTLIITSRPLTHDTTPEQIKDRGGLVERRKTKWCSFDVRRHVLAYERGDWEKPLRWYARPENIEDTLNRLERETDRVQKEREAYLASPEYAALQAKLKEKAKHPERREEMGPFDIFEPGDWWINTTITS